MLQRAHQQASRIAALNQQKKPAYVFGSSTPRELSYLEALKHQQRAQGPSSTTGKSSRDSTPSSHVKTTIFSANYDFMKMNYSGRANCADDCSDAVSFSCFGNEKRSFIVNNDQECLWGTRQTTGITPSSARTTKADVEETCSADQTDAKLSKTAEKGHRSSKWWKSDGEQPDHDPIIVCAKFEQKSGNTIRQASTFWPIINQ